MTELILFLRQLSESLNGKICIKFQDASFYMNQISLEKLKEFVQVTILCKLLLNIICKNVYFTVYICRQRQNWHTNT